MAAPFQHAGGGIWGLCDFLDKEGVESALTFDLMMIGRSIHDVGSPRLSWKELAAFIRHAPDKSELRRLSDKMAPYRTVEVQMIALATDVLAGANWQRGGGKGPRPKPILDLIERQVQAAEQDRKAPRNASDMAKIRESLRKRRAKSHAA